MRNRLIDLWMLAMTNPALDSDARAHIEGVLALEFLCVTVSARRAAA